MSDLRLVIFDVDGTLVDSQNEIMAAMALAHGDVGLPLPARSEIISRVGLSLDAFFHGLHPDRPDLTADLTAAYKDAFRTLADRHRTQPPPLFDGVEQVLRTLAAQPTTLLGLATGKSRRGVDRFVDQHGLKDVFLTVQTADTHPSKPNPSMLRAAMAETGVDAARCVFVGDTRFDMDMARAAGVGPIGVRWGYHPATSLGTNHILDQMVDLPEILEKVGVT